MRSIVNALEVTKNDHLVQSTMEIDGEDATMAVDLDDQNRRTQTLTDVLAALNKLWQQGSNGIVNAAEKLADACRDRKLFIHSTTFLFMTLLSIPLHFITLLLSHSTGALISIDLSFT